jgi:starch synthase
MTGIKVLAVASEIYPLVKTGGLADVTAALPRALRKHGVETVTLVPGYPAVKAALGHAAEVLALDDLFGGRARVLAAQGGGLDLFVLDAPHLFGRPGDPYVADDGRDWPDNAFRFGALGWIAARIAAGDAPGFAPDILHGHDWQAGLAMAYLAYGGRRRPATVFTAHNLAYQGQFPADLLGRLHLPPHAYAIDGVEHYGAIGFLKAGLQLADRITTVSPTYAKEIQTAAGGCGLEGLLRARSGVLSGIRNGIDVDVWNPETDTRIAARFDPSSLPSRSPNKAELQRRFGLAQHPGRLLFGVVSRLAWHKGIDLLADAVPALVGRRAQLVVLGTGEPEMEHRLRSLADAHAGQIGCLIGYDEDLAHLIQAGSDAVLVPSRFEPCGLTQLCAMHYGAIPLGARVGGLADTIVDPEEAAADAKPATGLHFFPVTSVALEAALHRAADLWSDRPGWRSLQSSCMGADVSWAEPARDYFGLYSKLLASRK